MGFYACLFALVMPFICWGAMAEPGHPHKRPHFVFSDPMLGQTDQPVPLCLSATPAPMPSSSLHHQRTQQPSSSADPAMPAGRAAPTLLVFSLLLLLTISQLEITRIDLYYRVRVITSIFARGCCLLVPVPPPRLALP
ncbi:MAG: hypothetical protein R3C14_17370 [Caldilineaceae bacterium]